mgnify:CR=1 FL=1
MNLKALLLRIVPVTALALVLGSVALSSGKVASAESPSERGAVISLSPWENILFGRWLAVDQTVARFTRRYKIPTTWTMQTFAWLASASLPRERRFKPLFPKGTGMLDGYDVPAEAPPWTTSRDLDVFVEAFEQSGFRGPLNFYRNIEPDWERTPFLAGAVLRQPVTFIAGAEDAVLTFYPQAVEHMERLVPGLRSKTLIPGAGHWVQQEKPEEVTRLLLEFLRGL